MSRVYMVVLNCKTIYAYIMSSKQVQYTHGPNMITSSKVDILKVIQLYSSSYGGRPKYGLYPQCPEAHPNWQLGAGRGSLPAWRWMKGVFTSWRAGKLPAQWERAGSWRTPPNNPSRCELSPLSKSFESSHIWYQPFNIPHWCEACWRINAQHGLIFILWEPHVNNR